ncbi:hypothetical protein AVEN_82263-1 [Araneus ventricosus]|uniref:Uncharacterized protein n=1 Tax=Araneus ventricosus TaxID=182803 RepID=A0A4Y2HDN8_ARAVE|nr:hypothetical protein AVEN_82263-1 [Araneus ventricosus]
MEQMRQTSSLDTKYSHNELSFLLAVDMKGPSETSIKNLPNISDFNLDRRCRSKLHMNKNEDSTAEYFYEGNAEEQDGIINTDEVISIYKMKETKCQRMSSPKNHANYWDLGFTNESVSNGNEMENCKEMIEMSLCSKKVQIEIVKSHN